MRLGLHLGSLLPARTGRRAIARALVVTALALRTLSGCGCEDNAVGQATTGVTLVEPAGKPDEFERAIDFGNVRVGALQKRTILLRNDGVTPATISKIELTTDSQDFYLDRPAELPRLEPKEELKLELRYLASEIGADAATIVIETDVAETPKYTLKVSGKGASSDIDVCTTAGAEEVCANAQPDGTLTIDVGEQAPGGELRKPLIVKNRGDAALTLSGMGPTESTSTEYAVAPDTLATVPGGAQAAYEVVYTPVDGGPDEGEIEIRSDDPLKPRVVVKIRAVGLAPALCVDPISVEFGEQALGSTGTQKLKLTSCGREKVTVKSLEALTMSPPPPGAPANRNVFGIKSPPSTPRDLAPGEFVELEVTYSPTHFVTDEGRLSIGNSLSVRPAFVSLHGRGSGCQLSVVPSPVNFGNVGSGGGRSVKTVQVRNTGTGDCLVSELVPPTAPFGVETAPVVPATIGAGGVLQIALYFAPTSQGEQNGKLELVTNSAGGRVTVPLVGNGIAQPKCDFQTTPTSLVFTGVNPGQQATQNVQVKNYGSEECYIVEAKVIPGTAPFSAPVSSGPFSPGSAINPGATATVPVTFKPTAAGSYTATLQIKYSDSPIGGGFPFPGGGGGGQTVDVALEGGTLQPCVKITPDTIDFGSVSAGGTSEQTFTINSCGQGALGIRGIAPQPGSSTDFTLPAPPRLPQFLAAGQNLPVRVLYKPRTDGPDFATIEVMTNDPNNPRATVKLKANAGAVCDKFLACNVDRLRFPTTEVGRPASLSVTCQSVGTQTVNVTGVRMQGAEFKASAGRLPRTVAPGSSIRFEITYTPQDVGTDTGSFVVAADTCQPASVAVDGIGKLPNYPRCLPPSTFSPVEKWAWGGGSTNTASKNVAMSPLVLNLTDDNVDGRIDQEDTPDVVFTSCKSGECCIRCFGEQDMKMMDLAGKGMLRAVHGKDGRELWSVTDAALPLTASTQLAAGDIDGDNVPEIIAVKHSFQPGTGSGATAGMEGKYKQGTLLVFDNTGKLKFETERWTGDEKAVEFNSSPTLTDLDADGMVEILFEKTVFKSNGQKLLDLPNSGNDGHGSFTVAMDLDGDDKPEIVSGRYAFRPDGTLLWQASGATNGSVMLLDLENDGTPEVILRDRPDRLLVLDSRTGSTKKTISWDLPRNSEGGTEAVCAAPTAAADLDGDRTPELIVPSGDYIYAFRGNGQKMWQAPITDYGGQCGAAGAAAFDFEGDGKFEVVYHDTQHIWAFRGTDGTKIYEAPRNSSTLWETPVVADVDNDNHADILITNENGILGIGSGAGVKALSNTGNNWAATRRIWNQHTYHVSDVNENASIPRVEVPGWKSTNSWRANHAWCKP